MKYAPRKVYIRESRGYVELSYTEFYRCRESDQTYIAVNRFFLGGKYKELDRGKDRAIRQERGRK